jgi:hypothetical protein
VRRARKLGVEFLQTELEMAKAFLDLAETTSNAAASRRNMCNAAKALNAVERFIERVSPELLQRQLLERRATELRRRLFEADLPLQSQSPHEHSPATAVRAAEQRGRQLLRESGSDHGGSRSPQEQVAAT